MTKTMHHFNGVYHMGIFLPLHPLTLGWTKISFSIPLAGDHYKRQIIPPYKLEFLFASLKTQPDNRRRRSPGAVWRVSETKQRYASQVRPRQKMLEISSR